MSVFRCYSEKKPGFDVEAQGLCHQLREQLGVASLESVRILNRYDADHIDPAVYQAAKTVVFSEPQVDDIWDETYPAPDTVHSVLAVEALPGQFDQRADSCAQCIQLQSGVDRPLIAYAKVYLLGGQLSQNELEKIRKYLINLCGQARHPGPGARRPRPRGCGGGLHRPGREGAGPSSV